MQVLKQGSVASEARMMRTGLLLASAVIGVVMVAGGFQGLSAQAGRYMVVDLGSLEPNGRSKPTAVNNNGEVVGGSMVSGNYHAFLYSNGSMWDLGVPDGWPFSWAYGINDSGAVVGYAGSASGSEAFLYRNGVMTNLGSLGAEGMTAAYAINNLGQVTGCSRYPDSDNRAFRTAPYQPINPLTDDIDPGGTGFGTVARAINDAGQVAGDFQTMEGGYAFRTAPNATLNIPTDDLGTLGGLGAYARGINSLGDVVGASALTAESTPRGAFLFTNGSMMSLGMLGPLPPGSSGSVANAVNDAGQVVGRSPDRLWPGRAFLWDAVNGMRDLNTLIPVGSGWMLVEAVDINNRGDIVGWGGYGTLGTRAFLLRQPPDFDEDPPSITCAAPDGLWHGADVTFSCTAQDSGSGLAHAADAAFSLLTSVPDGAETADASTDSRTVCDNFNNCATAGPISGNKVDKLAPSVSISTPTATVYLLNETVVSDYACTDGGSGVSVCAGLVPTGANIDTASVGTKSFVVNATDSAGNSVWRYVTYFVGSVTARRYHLTDLGAPGGSQSFAYAINQPGQVVGRVEASDGSSRAVLWDHGTVTDLGTLPNTGDCIPCSINASAQVVGDCDEGAPYYLKHAFLWSAATGMVALGTLGSPDNHQSYAYGINDQGQVVGGASTALWEPEWGGPGLVHAFLWQSGTMVDIGVLFPSPTRSVAEAINNLGQVAIRARQSSPYWGTWVWQNGNIRQVVTFGHETWPTAIDPLGRVLGDGWGAPGRHAFRWDNGLTTDLAPPGSTSSGAQSGNSAGDAVGSAPIGPGPENFRAVLFHEGTMTSLESHVHPTFEASGWQWLSFASGINESGEIVGYGLLASGERHAFLLTPVEPDTTPPTIVITSPTAETYVLGAPVNASYSCSDAESTVASCVGSVPNGTAIDTATVGTKSFVVDATDSAGNGASRTVTYSVGYGAIGPAVLWVGLKNSDAVGIRFDLLAEVLLNGTVVGFGQVDYVRGGSSGFNNAVQTSIPLTLASPIVAGLGSQFAIKVSVRNTCSGKTHNSGGARLWFNDAAAGSGVVVTTGSDASSYYLQQGFALATVPGPGPKQYIDVSAGSPCSAWKPFGTWSVTIQ